MYPKSDSSQHNAHNRNGRSARYLIQLISLFLLMSLFAACSATPGGDVQVAEAEPVTSNIEPTAVSLTEAPPTSNVPSSEALIDAIDAGDVSEIQRLLEAGADPNEASGQVYPMVKAVLLDNIEVVKLLVAYGGDPGLAIGRQTLADIATSAGNYQIAAFLHSQNAPLAGGSWITGEMNSPALATNSFGDPGTRSYLAYLPPSYNEQSSKRYPVVYALHGASPLAESELIHWGVDLDRMIVAGSAPEMIIIFPNLKNVFGSTYRDSVILGNNEQYITQDLVDYVDANFRTIPNRDSRAIAGCAPGAAAAVNNAFQHPDIYSVVVGVTGLYDAPSDVLWERARRQFRGAPDNFARFSNLDYYVQIRIAFAAESAPNPATPPFFLDMPYEMIDGEAHIVPEVAEKINANYTTSLLPQVLDTYLAQPDQLRGIMLFHNETNQIVPLAHMEALSNLLTASGIEHELYVDDTITTCGENPEPFIQFIADNLVAEAQ